MDCFNTRASDLSPLKGMELTSLDCSDAKVSDLSPLKDMRLTSLNCYKTHVSDLSPLKGMKLEYLNCGDTNVSDLSPLKGKNWIVFAVLVLFSGAVWLCLGVPLAVLSIFNRMRWGVVLHSLALTPLLALICFLAYYLFLTLRALSYP